jgi:hypothetical protein
MPIEIKELIIRAVAVETRDEEEEIETKTAEEEKEEEALKREALVEASVRQVLRILRQTRDR